MDSCSLSSPLVASGAHPISFRLVEEEKNTLSHFSNSCNLVACKPLPSPRFVHNQFSRMKCEPNHHVPYHTADVTSSMCSPSPRKLSKKMLPSPLSIRSKDGSAFTSVTVDMHLSASFSNNAKSTVPTPGSKNTRHGPYSRCTLISEIQSYNTKVGYGMHTDNRGIICQDTIITAGTIDVDDDDVSSIGSVAAQEQDEDFFLMPPPSISSPYQNAMLESRKFCPRSSDSGREKSICSFPDSFTSFTNSNSRISSGSFQLKPRKKSMESRTLLMPKLTPSRRPMSFLSQRKRCRSPRKCDS